jgi:hypothetical protein
MLIEGFEHALELKLSTMDFHGLIDIKRTNAENKLAQNVMGQRVKQSGLVCDPIEHNGQRILPRLVLHGCMLDDKKSIDMYAAHTAYSVFIPTTFTLI